MGNLDSNGTLNEVGYPYTTLSIFVTVCRHVPVSENDENQGCEGRYRESPRSVGSTRE